MTKWLDFIKNEQGSLSDRVLNDECEKNFWKNFLASNKNLNKEAYSYKIFEEVSKIIHTYKPKTILELGCGWGNYTMDLASICKELTCLDISSDNLNFVKKRAQENGINNIVYVNEKFESYDIGTFDLIFAYNCFYRIIDIESVLRKINNSSKVAIIGMNSNIDRDSTISIESELGLSVKKSKLSYLNLVNELDNLKISFNKKILDVHREYSFESLKEAYEYEKRFILDEIYDDKSVEEIVSKYYIYNGKNFVQSHNIVSGILFWECNRKI